MTRNRAGDVMANHKVAAALDDRHLERLEQARPSMAKANLKELEIEWREQIGRAIQRAFALAGWTQKEGAAKVGRDTGQVGRWINGTERPQLDALFAVEELRPALIQALAELARYEVVTRIELRRFA